MLFRTLITVSIFCFSHLTCNNISAKYGSIHYFYESNKLVRIERTDSQGQFLYAHNYIYDETGNLIEEQLIGGLGTISYPKVGVITSPYYEENCTYDDCGNVISRLQDGTTHYYSYNESGIYTDNHSQETCSYNEDGALIQKGEMFFSYDYGNLSSINTKNLSVSFQYNAENRRISKTVNGETFHFLYFREHEIGITDDEGNILALRVLSNPFRNGLAKAVAIETPSGIYAPIHDSQHNIVKLVDINTGNILSLSKPDPFGKNLDTDTNIPWIFSGKHYDKESNLVYFGARYYSPELRKWTSQDPAKQTEDPYLYCFNNPFRYFDADGCISEELQKAADEALIAQIEQLEEESKEHMDNMLADLRTGFCYSIALGVSIAGDCLPLIPVEFYGAQNAFSHAYDEYQLYSICEANKEFLLSD